MNLKALQQWSKRSLANSIALQASVIAIGSGFFMAAISLSVLYWSQSNALHQQLQQKAVRLTDRIERTITVAERAVSDLATSSMFTTAILDSAGRNAYVEPFLANFTLPIPATSGIALCDINGVRLAGTDKGMSDCRADSPLFQQVLKDGKTVRELVTLKNGHLAWTVYQGVIFIYTGTVEGVVVTQVDLQEILAPAARDLDLERVALAHINSAEEILSVGLAGESTTEMNAVKQRLFKDATDASPFPMEVSIWSHSTAFEGFLLPLFLNYGLGILLLVAGVVYWTRKMSLYLLKPLVELTAISHEISESGNMSIEIPVAMHGELGQLSSAFQAMVNTISASEERLENQVVMRTRQLQAAEASLRSVFEAATEMAIIATDPQGLITLFNPGAERILGYQVEEAIGKMMLFQYNLPDELRARAAQRIKAGAPPVSNMELLLDESCDDGFSSNEWTWLRKDAGHITIKLSVTPIYDEHFVLTGYLGVAEDVTEQKLVEGDMRIAATAFDSHEGMMVTDENCLILRVNSAFTDITGYSVEEIVGQNPKVLSSGRHDAAFYAAMWMSINNTGRWEGEVYNRRKNGEIYPQHLTITAVKNQHGKVTNFVATLADITTSKATEEEIRTLAFYDPLTRLPNRRLLMDRLKQALTASERSGRKGALLFLDLDHFKDLNDTLGHDIGDLLLQQVALRLELCVRADDTVARLGGDEFVMILEDLDEQAEEAAAQTKAIGEKILVSLNQRYQLEDYEYHNSPSIGATLFVGHVQPQEELLKQADIALYQAKNAGRNMLRFFDPRMQDAINTRTALEDELRKALESGEFNLYYQIQVDDTRRPLGAEALIRWRHPERGLLSPAQFIPLAEETGLILPIGLWVLEAACSQLKLWQTDPLTRGLVLAVNVSARQFHQPDFVTQVQRLLQKSGAQPSLLKLELTESILLDNVEKTIAVMGALKESGIQFSLDDFGTGYSSLQYLKKLPLNQLKIDQSFVRDIAVDGSDQAIVRTIISMAHSLSLEVIAEGVEDEQQRQFLLDKGCAQFQGYLFGKPLPIEQFEAWLQQTGSL